MLQSAKSLIGYTLTTSDGEIGKVTDFYFDDRNWEIRYVRVETGNWLFGRRVLIFPHAVTSVDVQHKTFVVAMTKEEVKHSPDINTDLPVSLQMEVKLYNYYSLSSYGSAGGLPTADMINESTELQSEENSDISQQNPHLRSVAHVSGYQVKSRDKIMGTVDCFLLDARDWSIRFLMLKMADSSSAGYLIFPTDLVNNIDWASSTITVEHDKSGLLTETGVDEEGHLPKDIEMKLPRKD